MSSLAMARRHPSRLVALWSALAVAGLAAAGLSLWKSPGRAPGPPVLAELPDFALQDKSGRAIGRRDLQGRVWVADFIFTHCAGTCPAITARMATLQRRVPDDVTLVSFTVDPARDTPAILARYADSVGAGPGWLFLTGAQEAVHRLATGGFKLAAMEVPPGERGEGDGPFVHSTKLVLVDRQARVRGYYDSTDEAAVRSLLEDLARVREEGA